MRKLFTQLLTTTAPKKAHLKPVVVMLFVLQVCCGGGGMFSKNLVRADSKVQLTKQEFQAIHSLLSRYTI